MALLVIHLGCYQSAFPVETPPSVPVDAALLDTWRCQPTHDDSPLTIAVTRASAYVYALQLQAPGDPAEHYEAYATDVGRRRVLNIKDPKAARPWTFATYELHGQDRLSISLFTDKGLAHTPTTPEALKHALTSQQATYETLCHCTQVGQSPP
jgi:hypothetical protein